MDIAGNGSESTVIQAAGLDRLANMDRTRSTITLPRYVKTMQYMTYFNVLIGAQCYEHQLEKNEHA